MTAPAWWAQTCASLRDHLPQLRTAVYASGGSPYHHAALVAHWGGVPVPLGARAIAAGELDAFDVLIVPGGGLRGMGGLLTPLGQDGTRAVRRWVEAGGTYIGSCAGSFLPARWPEAFRREHAGLEAMQLLELPLAGDPDGPGNLLGVASPGVGAVELRRTAHPLAAGLPERFLAVHYNGPCFLPPPGQGVATLVAHGEHFTPWERSLPDAPTTAPLLVDHLIRQGASAAAAAPCGRGQAVLFGSHPEFGFSALQLGWGQAARLLANALRTVRPRPHHSEPALPEPGPQPTLSGLAAAFDRASTRFRGWTPNSVELAQAPGFQGKDASGLSQASLSEAGNLCGLVAWTLRAPGLSSLPQTARHWLSCEPEKGQDYGFVGLAQLAGHLHALLDRAQAAPPPPVPTSPYSDWEHHPYHLTASSYLSAAGLAASAALATGTLLRLADFPFPSPYPLFSPDRRHHD